MLASIGTRNDSGDNIAVVIEDIEDMLEMFKPRLQWHSFRESLRDIVQKAVALDETFCGQQGWYAIKYPERRYDFHVDLKTMVPVDGTSHKRVVGFAVRPCLSRAGGVRGESYNEYSILEPHTVWTC